MKPSSRTLIWLAGLLLAASSVIAAPPEAPANDDCANCEQITVAPGGNATVSGSTTTATADTNAIDCGTSVSAPGVWYKVTGTGNTMTASTCDQADYDTKINVYCEDCATPKCVAGNDDGILAGCTGFTSDISFPTQAGAEYKILVQGFSGATGDFDLTVSDDDTPSVGAINCDDQDNDGVPNVSDACSDTVVPEGGVPKSHLAVGRYALTTGGGCSGEFAELGTICSLFPDLCIPPNSLQLCQPLAGPAVFDTVGPPGGGQGHGREYTLEDTAGCSCEQILNELGLSGQGHEFFGCTKAVMDRWIRHLNTNGS